MNLEDKTIDFCLSLVYASKNLEDYKEYKDLLKVIDKDYLKQIKDYQVLLQHDAKSIDFFVNEDYNLLSYIQIDYQATHFEDLYSQLITMSKKDFFQIISTHILEKETSFSIQDLLKATLSDKHKWKLTELYYNFEAIKQAFLTVITRAWSRYLTLVDCLEKQFNPKISREQKRLLQQSDELYETVYRDYISKQDYLSARSSHLFLVSFQKILFIKVDDFAILGLGLFTYDYFNLIKTNHAFNQEIREKYLKILADPTRYGILKLIIEGISSNKIIANKFGISSAAVSYQLKNFLDHKLIVIDSDSRNYALNKKLLRQILAGIEKELFLD